MTEQTFTRTIISDGNVLTPSNELRGYTVIVEGGKIRSVEKGTVEVKDGDLYIDAHGYWVTPGLIDVHFHGCNGYDTLDATQESLYGMAEYLAKRGVTSYLPTTFSADPEVLCASIENVARCPQPDKGAQHLGIHIEGPYLTPKFRGAQQLEQLRPANPKEYRVWFQSGVVRLITIAPEVEGALDLVKEGFQKGIGFAIGHSNASYEQVGQAADLGVRQATHVFNGMQGLHHREPGTAGAVLTDDRIFAQVIADGIHLHPAIVKLVVRCKGVNRTILITDSIKAAGLVDGHYEVDGLKINVENGVARTITGGLAGSTITLVDALKNTMLFTGLGFSEVLQMATTAPAEALGLPDQIGCLKKGADADILFFDQYLNIALTMVKGKIVFQKGDVP